MKVLLKHIFKQNIYGPYGQILDRVKHHGWIDGTLCIKDGRAIITNDAGNVLFNGSLSLLEYMLAPNREMIKLDE